MTDMRLKVPRDDDSRRRLSRRLLQDLHYGALAAEYVVPDGWQPLDLVVRGSTSGSVRLLYHSLVVPYDR